MFDIKKKIKKIAFFAKNIKQQKKIKLFASAR